VGSAALEGSDYDGTSLGHLNKTGERKRKVLRSLRALCGHLRSLRGHHGHRSHPALIVLWLLTSQLATCLPITGR